VNWEQYPTVNGSPPSALKQLNIHRNLTTVFLGKTLIDAFEFMIPMQIMGGYNSWKFTLYSQFGVKETIVFRLIMS
jgi:hypothetical protein